MHFVRMYNVKHKKLSSAKIRTTKLFAIEVCVVTSLKLPEHRGYCMNNQVTIFTISFNTHKFYVLPTQCIYVFCVDLRTNSDYFTVQH